MLSLAARKTAATIIIIIRSVSHRNTGSVGCVRTPDANHPQLARWCSNYSEVIQTACFASQHSCSLIPSEQKNTFLPTRLIQLAKIRSVAKEPSLVSNGSSCFDTSEEKEGGRGEKWKRKWSFQLSLLHRKRRSSATHNTNRRVCTHRRRRRRRQGDRVTTSTAKTRDATMIYNTGACAHAHSFTCAHKHTSCSLQSRCR